MRYASGAREMRHRLQEKEKERDQHNTIDSLIIFYVNYDLWAIYTQIHNGSHFFFSRSIQSPSLSLFGVCLVYLSSALAFTSVSWIRPIEIDYSEKLFSKKKLPHIKNIEHYWNAPRRSHDWWNWPKIRRVAETKINKFTSRRNRDCN